MQRTKRYTALFLTLAMVASLFVGLSVPAAAESANIKNDSLSVNIGDLGQIEVMNVLNNRPNSQGNAVNFVLPNNTSPQNNENHQWMGEMIFSYRTSEDGTFPEGREGFVEVDTNRTMAAGGSTTYSNATENLAANPYIKKNVVSDKKVEIDYIGHAADSETARAMKGFNAKSVFDMETEDDSLLWSVTIENTSEDYIEFGDVGLPMPWNNKYTNQNSVYRERVTAHTFAGADSGYAYAIRCNGQGNYVMFTPVIESGARIEYVDFWMRNFQGVNGERNADIFTNWQGDTGGWQPGLSVYYIHSKDISKTGRGYFDDTTSLVLAPGASKTYQFKFSAVRGGDGTAQESADSPNNATNMMEERETNHRSVLYDAGMIDAVALPSFQTVINMPTKLALHYDSSKISDVVVDIQNTSENDPYGLTHIPLPLEGRVNNARTGRGLPGGNPGYEESVKFVETKIIEGEEYHIYELAFDVLGNNSVRVDYKFGEEKAPKFTQFEFNVMAEIDAMVETHSDFMLEYQADKDPESDRFGIYEDWYFASGKDTSRTHWADDWSHDNVDFMVMKNYLKPDPEEVKSLENYLIDFMWESFMDNTHRTYRVSNGINASGIYSENVSPGTRTFSEMMECVAFFNMYRIMKAYPGLIEYRETPEYYLEKAYGIYYNRVGAGTTGFYGEQQVPDIIEALYAEGMTEEGDNLKEKFALTKGRNISVTENVYGSEFVYDNTGEEGAFSAMQALLKYYPDDDRAALAKAKLAEPEWKSRAMRGIQPTWYHYGVPVFLGGEGWWNFQYTASLAGSILDDYLRYQDNGYSDEQDAWASRVNYAAKLSNFNAINMGQIDDDYVGNVAWRYSMFKGGRGAMNVNDGGTRVMNNGWNDFSGEADEGIYGSLLRISADVVNDPIFGLYGYGANVTNTDGVYTVTPLDGIGKRINLIGEKVYVESEQDKITSADIAADGGKFTLNVENLLSGAAHLSNVTLSGAGIADGFYSISVNGAAEGQVYFSEGEAVANYSFPAGDAAVVVIERLVDGENTAPTVKSAKVDTVEVDLEASLPIDVSVVAYDDGAPAKDISYTWGVSKAPEGASVLFREPNAYATEFIASAAGDYTLTMSVSDGEKQTVTEVPVSLRQPPIFAGDKYVLANLVNWHVDTPTNIYEVQTAGEFEAALAAAQSVVADRYATQEEIDAAYTALSSTFEGLIPFGGNYALMANVSTSFVSSWESLEAVNDNIWPASMNSNGPGPHYGSYGSSSLGETITYTWDRPVVMNKLNIFFWTDNSLQNDGTWTSGNGIKVPANYAYEYQNEAGDWVAIPNADGLTTYPGGAGVMSRFNTIELAEPTVANAVRVYIEKPSSSGGVGVYEWQVIAQGYDENNAKASVTGTESVASDEDATAEYVISGANMPVVSGIELEFEIDSAYLAEKEITPIGFTPIGGAEGSKIYWRTVGDRTVGKVVLVEPEGVSGDADLLKMVFDVTEGIVGTSNVKLNYVKMSFGGKTVNAYIAANTQKTEFVKYYSPYDVNRDEVVDLNDITFALVYFMLDEGSAEWEDAKICDVSEDGVIDISDLVLILANYTDDYYTTD